MYRANENNQNSFLDFNQPLGLHMNPNNRWVKKAANIPWNHFEKRYSSLFQSNTGNVAKPLRMALGSLIIQAHYAYSDQELVAQIQENPYYQYFIGLSGYQEEASFEASSLVHFRKRLSFEMIMEANEYLINPPQSVDDREDDDKDDFPPSGAASQDSLESEEIIETDKKNIGTMMLDATCAPSNIKYPQDFELLSNAREKLQEIMDRLCADYGFQKPRMYRYEARKNYLGLAKSKRRSRKKIRKVIRKQLGYVKRDLGYLEGFMSKGYALLS